MKEPCRSCPEKAKDFGGCRCQAYLLTGDAANADPVCDLSPHHHLVTEAVARSEHPTVRSIRWCSETIANARAAAALQFLSASMPVFWRT